MPKETKPGNELQRRAQLEVDNELREDDVEIVVRKPRLGGMDPSGCNWTVVCKGPAPLGQRIFAAVDRVRARYNMRDGDLVHHARDLADTLNEPRPIRMCL